MVVEDKTKNICLLIDLQYRMIQEHKDLARELRKLRNAKVKVIP